MRGGQVCEIKTHFMASEPLRDSPFWVVTWSRLLVRQGEDRCKLDRSRRGPAWLAERLGSPERLLQHHIDHLQSF